MTTSTNSLLNFLNNSDDILVQTMKSKYSNKSLDISEMPPELNDILKKYSF